MRHVYVTYQDFQKLLKIYHRERNSVDSFILGGVADIKTGSRFYKSIKPNFLGSCAVCFRRNLGNVLCFV
jgi:hypothetical protein